MSHFFLFQSLHLISFGFRPNVERKKKKNLVHHIRRDNMKRAHDSKMPWILRIFDEFAKFDMRFVITCHSSIEFLGLLHIFFCWFVYSFVVDIWLISIVGKSVTRRSCHAIWSYFFSVCCCIERFFLLWHVENKKKNATNSYRIRMHWTRQVLWLMWAAQNEVDFFLLLLLSSSLSLYALCCLPDFIL